MRHTKKLLAAAAFAATGALGFSSQSHAATFNSGDLVVYRVGDGSAALSSAPTAVFLDDYSTTGVAGISLEMPTAVSGSNNPLSASGTATSEGALSLSGNGQLLILTGYDAAPGSQTTSIVSTATTAVPRVVGEVGANGNINTSTTTTAYSTNNIRGATSDNGTNIWITGANTGLVYTTLGSSGPGTIVYGSSTGDTTNLRVPEISNGQLYTSTASGTNFRIGAIGTGLPTLTAQTATNLPGLGTGANPSATAGVEAGPYAYAFATLGGGSTPNTLYVADNGFGNSTASGALEKWSLESGTWVETGSVTETGLTGLAIEPVSGGEALFFTTPGAIFSLTDASGFGGTLSGTPTSIAAAGTNEAFRGIAFAPSVAPAPEPASLSLLAMSGAMLLLRRSRKADR